MSKTTIFHIEGGIGKNIVATSVIRSYKKQNPDNSIIVSTAWPDIFTNNKNVDRSYSIGNVPYFYKDFIYGKDVEIFAHDPYKTTNHITKKKPLVESWCEMIGVEYDGKNPEIFFNFREKEAAKFILPKKQKPILILQPFGGPQIQELPYSWTRDIHPNVAQAIVDHLKSKYDIVHICYEHHPVLNDVIRLDKPMNKKILLALLGYSSQRILIDSSLQHAAAAMGLSSKVVWVATDPKIFGYDQHQNILPREIHPEGHINSYLFDYNFTGVIQECPYEFPEQIFNFNEIIADL